MVACTTISGTIAIGYKALTSLVDSGTSNVAIGYNALEDLTTGDDNLALGYNAGRNITTGSRNTCLGPEANQALTTGSSNTAIGYIAGYVNTGDFNTFVGAYAGDANTSGDQNTAIGCQALGAITTADACTAVGHSALETCTGQQNTAVGQDAGGGLTTGNYNTFLGCSAGDGQTTGGDNVYIGNNCGENDGTNGEVMIYNGTNTARFQGSGTSWSITSDGRDKTDYKDLELGVEFLKKIKPRQFKWDWRDGKKEGNGTIRSGFIAQEVLEACDAEGLSRTPEDSITSNKVYPGVVDITNPDKYQVAAGDFVPMLVKAVQELSAKNDELAAEVASLKSQINN